MICSCPVCNGKDINQSGIEVAEKEVIPYFKGELLKLKNLDHPFPMKYDGLLGSIFAFSQALAYDRAHSRVGNKYITSNKWMLKFANELASKYKMDVISMPKEKIDVREVCEFNIKD